MLINQACSENSGKWGKSPGEFGDHPYRSVIGRQKMAEFRALRLGFERMLHLRARTFLITHHPQPRVPCQAPVNPRFEHVVHVLGRWPLVETRAGIEATDKANSLRKAPTH